MPVEHPRYEDPATESLRLLKERCEGDPAFEAVFSGITEQRIEVVERPTRFVARSRRNASTRPATNPSCTAVVRY